MLTVDEGKMARESLDQGVRVVKGYFGGRLFIEPMDDSVDGATWRLTGVGVDWGETFILHFDREGRDHLIAALLIDVTDRAPSKEMS